MVVTVCWRSSQMCRVECRVQVQGADDVFNLATGVALGQQTGNFFAGRGVMQQPAVAEDSSARQQLWSLMEEQTSSEYSLPGSS